jgi:hypothetical protein
MRSAALQWLFAVVVVFGSSAPALAHLHHALQRFAQRDPINYVEGPNVYLPERAKPVNALDPSGRCRDCPPFHRWSQAFPANVPNPDGCSVPPGIPIGDPDNPTGDCNFKPACDKHDLCYSNCSRLKSDCDDELKNNLLAACTNCASQHGWTFLQIELCNEWAESYASGVHTGGGGAYCNRQELNCYCKPCDGTH